jgi:CRISPR-associated protein (TIGR03986 family)
MSKFHHPYNFIPVNGNPPAKLCFKPGDPDDKVARGAADSHARHDLWQQGNHSGRVICKLHLHTPTMVGGAHAAWKKGQSTKVEHYKVDGTEAIPANSLRGMVGSVAEAISQSALRVLQDRTYSVREKRAVPALGILVASSDPDRRFDIRPLTIPALKENSGNYRLDAKWQKVFRANGKAVTLAQCLSAYVDGYVNIAQGAGVNMKKTKFLISKNPDAFHDSRPAYYYAQLTGVPNTLNVDNLIPNTNSGLRIKTTKKHDGTITGYFLVGQTLANPNGILTEAEWNANENPRGYTKGFLRVLGNKDRETHLPPTKKHELFIPEPTLSCDALPVQECVVREFEVLASERDKDTKDDDVRMPFSLEGYPGWKPRVGDLFFFDVELDNDRPVVTRISISSMWRRLVNGSSWQFFEGNISQDTVPWNPNRNNLTPAELLFGVVEDCTTRKPKPERGGRNLASRVSFSDAVWLGKKSLTRIGETTLRILASPKPPCPAMYFHPKNGSQGTFVSKASLNIGQHKPNGRKVYLPHPVNGVNKAYVETKSTKENQDQKMICNPLEKDQDFYFHVDFENLTKAELTLLLRSLRPADNFCHRLGLGKPLGLGMVEIAVEGLFLMDRVKRYDENPLDAPRYHRVWREAATTAQMLDLLANSYPTEVSALQATANNGPATGKLENQTGWYDPSLIDDNTRNILAAAGNASKLAHKVVPPLTGQQGSDYEKETFKWFVANEKKSIGQAQALQPIQADLGLPILKND